MMVPLLRALQTCTAAAAVLTVLGGCGLAPAPSRRPRPIARPPRSEVTIRSLTGTWAGLVETPAGPKDVVISLLQTGIVLTGSLTVDGRTLQRDPAVSGRLDVSGQFHLAFGQGRETILVHGGPDSSGDRLSAWVTGVAPQPVLVTFTRR
jgi:hypothetical protein